MPALTLSQEKPVSPRSAQTAILHPVISLFCGAGGLDYGFRQAGFQTILACDNAPAAIRTYNFNARRRIATLLDLATAKGRDLIELIENSAPSISPIGVIGGPPCQGFSQGNVYADPNDPRNKLPFKYAEILAELNERYSLKFFIFENVKGLANKKHAHRLARLKSCFKSAGFNVYEKQLNAKSFGVAQSRPRLFLVGLNSKLYSHVDFPFPEGASPRLTVKDAIGGLPDPVFFARTLKLSDRSFHPNHWTMMPKSAKFGVNFKNSGRSFRVLSWEEPSPTVAYGNREIHIHPNGTRRLSILEAMLLQGFPQSYRLMGTLSEQVTQVSNAVPPPIARALAGAIKKTIQKGSL